MSHKPGVGLGIIILNEDGHVLVGKRKNAVPTYYSIPGGGLEHGETFEEGAIREVKEETGIDVHEIQVIGLTNNLETQRESGVHYISVVLHATAHTGEPALMEPDKCEEWIWVNPQQLPTPHFDASRMAIDGFLNSHFYKQYF